MASEFCNITPEDNTNSILNLLPPLPSINQVADLINIEVNNLKIKYTNKTKNLILNFAEGVCPSPQQIDRYINTRNNIVNQLSRVFNKVDRLSNNISGISNFLSVILTGIKVASGIVTGITIAGSIIPFPIPAAVNSVVEGGQTAIEKAKFKNNGEQRLTPLIGGIISANIAVKLFASALRELICTIEALDAAILECSSPSSEDENTPPPTEEVERFKEVQTSLIPIPNEVISFIEEDVAEQEDSLTNTAYRGFTFEIEEIPFSPTVNRRRAVAKNSSGIVTLQTELSFTSTPDILIQELKLVIDRDSLRAE